MKTKIIPFDLETAKKIQAGEIKGKIKTRNGEDVRIVAWDRKNEHHTPITALVDYGEKESTVYYSENGEYDFGNNTHNDLVLEVPDNEPQFKPFDKVLVRNWDNEIWICDMFSLIHKDSFLCIGGVWKQCVPYEGNECLLGTTDKPKEA